MIFAGVSGAAVADCAGLGAIEIKAMKERGYKPEFAAAVTVCSAVVGPIIPPSIGLVIFAFLAAFGIVRLKMKNGLLWFLLIYSGTVFPFQMYLLPLFEAYVAIGIYNTKFGLILMYVSICIPFATFVLRGFFLTVPWELQELAKIEGASNLQILYKIMMPLAKAPLLLVFLIQFTWIWNDLLFGMVLSRSTSVRPVTSALVGMQNLYAQMDGPTILMATVMASIPTLVIFLLLQRHFIRGLTLGSMGTGKG